MINTHYTLLHVDYMLIIIVFIFFSCYRFRIDNTDHIIDVNKNNAAFEYDQVNIICPVYQPGTYDDDAEKYIIYNVSILSQQEFILAKNLFQKKRGNKGFETKIKRKILNYSFTSN